MTADNWTEEQTAKLRESRAQGLGDRRLAALLGKSRHEVRHKWLRLMLIEKRLPSIAPSHPIRRTVKSDADHSKPPLGAVPFHPYANIFPLIGPADLDVLAGDIEAQGLIEQIVLLDGQILDGRNRYLALRHSNADLSPESDPDIFRNYEGDDPLHWVISKNLRRRHLNESQRAMVAANLANMRQGERTDLEPSANLQKVARSDAAKQLQVSTRSVADATKVKNEATPEIVRAVEQGTLAVSAAAAAAKLAPAQQRRIAEEAEAGHPNAARTIIKQEGRAARETELGAKQQALPEQKFGVILADPEWHDEVWSDETGLDRHAGNHYPTSKDDVIASRPVAEIAAPDCVLFLWTTNQHLRIALHVMEAWGFEYKSNYCWGKDRISLGRWQRGKHELLLIGTRGKPPCPAPGTQWDSLQLAPKGKHSAKPERFLEMIEEYYPTLPKIELNRRGPSRAGWKAWGNEAADPGDPNKCFTCDNSNTPVSEQTAPHSPETEIPSPSSESRAPVAHGNDANVVHDAVSQSVVAQRTPALASGEDLEIPDCLKREKVE